MTDKYADIRAALEAGPTSGPWKVSDDTKYPSGITGPNGRDVLWGCGCCGSPNLTKKDADHIAACHPESIRALLAERDFLNEECLEQARLNGMGSEREARLMVERDALREALDELANGYAGTGWDIGLRQRLHKARALLDE